MPEILRRLLLSLLALAPLAALAAPTPFVAEYEVLRKGKPAGVAEVRLDRDGEQWQLRTETRGTAGMASMVGLEVSESSRFVLVDGQPEAREYRYRQKAAMRSRERSVEVDPAAGRVLSRDREREHAFDYRPGVIDRHLVAFALGQRLMRDREAGLELTVADRDFLGEHRYRVIRSERIRVPEGEHAALEVERQREDPRGRSTRYWFDPARGITLRLLQREQNGDELELRLVRFAAGD